MTIYFESPIEVSIDMFIPHIGLLIFIFAFYKFSPLFNVISEALNIKKQKLLVCLFSLFTVVLFFGVLNFIKLSSYANTIENKLLSSVSGCIQNYQSTLVNSREESFEIEGIEFKYNNYATPKYFFANRKYGDEFIRNNQCVNIYYIHENAQNHIVKIERSL